MKVLTVLKGAHPLKKYSQLVSWWAKNISPFILVLLKLYSKLYGERLCGLGTTHLLLISNSVLLHNNATLVYGQSSQ